MGFADRLAEDLKRAMKNKDQLRMDVIRMVKAAILNKEIELKKELDDPELTRVMSGLVKQRREAVEYYQNADRADLASKELKEIEIIQEYLPAELTREQILAVVDTVIQDVGARTIKDTGPVMKAVMAKLSGHTVDGKLVNELVRVKLQ